MGYNYFKANYYLITLKSLNCISILSLRKFEVGAGKRLRGEVRRRHETIKSRICNDPNR